MQIDKEKFLALSLSMTLGGAATSLTSGCKKKNVPPDMGIANPQIDPYSEGYIEPYEEYYPPAEEYYDDMYYDQPYGSCAPVWEGTIDPFMYSYSTYNECYIRCFEGDQTQCYNPQYECVNWDPTTECIGWEEYMGAVYPRAGFCSFWEVFEQVPGIPTIECVQWHP